MPERLGASGTANYLPSDRQAHAEIVQVLALTRKVPTVLRTHLKGYVLLHAFRAGAKQHPASSAIISLARSAHNFAALADDCQEIMRDDHTLEPWFEVPSTQGHS